MSKHLFDLVGLGSTTALVAMTYWAFRFLDKEASPRARRALSAWIQGRAFAPIDIRSAIVAMFDHLYSNPLFSIRGFARSSGISMAIYIAFYFSYVSRTAIHSTAITFINVSIYILVNGGTNIASDYISLFPIRKFLKANNLPFWITLFSPVFITTICFVILNTVVSTLAFAHFYDSPLAAFPGAVYFWTQFFSLKVPSWFYPNMIPPMLVTLWLPLLAIGATGVRLLSGALRAILWAQWFIKEGNQHPLRAIGLVASAVVMVVVGAGHLIL
jgi:hypothetical protein